MKSFSAITTLIVAALLTESTILAFSPAASSPRLSTTRLHSADYDKGRIKKAGAGVTTQAPGDLCFYDPNEQGLLQGSNNLMDRLENGASYTVSGAVATPTPQPGQTPTAKPNSFTTNLTNLLGGKMGYGGSQY